MKHKVPVIFQSEAAECGIACMAMVMNAHGLTTDILTLRQKFSASLKGLTLRHLMEMAAEVGLSARPLKADLSRLKDVKTPAILHWNLNHFVVLTAASDTKLEIHDPGRGAVKMSLSEASKHYTGVAVDFERTNNLSPPEKIPRLRISHLWSSISGIRAALTQILALSIILQLFAVATPFYMQVVIDDAITRFDQQMALALCIAFVLLVFINTTTEFLRKYVIMTIGHNFTFQIIGNLIRHLLSLPSVYFEKRNIGDIITRINSTEPIQRAITQDSVAGLIDGVMTIIMLCFMLFYSVKLTLLVLLFTTIFAVSSIWLIPKIRSYQEKLLYTEGTESSYKIETIRAFRAIKMFGRESDREAGWRNLYTDVINDSIHLQRTIFMQEAFNTLLFGIQLSAIVYFGAVLVMQDQMTVGMLFAFLAYRQTFAQRIGELIQKVISFKLVGLHLERLSDIALAERESDAMASREAYRAIEGGIYLDRVSFRYSKQDPYIFEDLSLEIPAGQYAAIAGSSGSGKSTLLKVMLGFLKPEEGAIAIDGAPLSRLGLRAWRSQIGVVMQDDTLLSGTLLDNITFFDPTPDKDWAYECARVAQIHNDIMAMPMTYLSLVGDMGAALSGGQRQRILLARALYNRPRVLFLDEGTANLDEESERAIGETISAMPITRVIIAHRPELIRRADVVYRVENGHISRVTPDIKPVLTQEKGNVA